MSEIIHGVKATIARSELAQIRLRAHHILKQMRSVPYRSQRYTELDQEFDQVLAEIDAMDEKYFARCRSGVHLRVLEGSGMMQDGLTCVDCGRDKFPEVFGIAVEIRQWPGMIDRTPEGRECAWKEAKKGPSDPEERRVWKNGVGKERLAEFLEKHISPVPWQQRFTRWCRRVFS